MMSSIEQFRAFANCCMVFAEQRSKAAPSGTYIQNCSIGHTADFGKLIPAYISSVKIGLQCHETLPPFHFFFIIISVRRHSVNRVSFPEYTHTRPIIIVPAAALPVSPAHLPPVRRQSGIYPSHPCSARYSVPSTSLSFRPVPLLWQRSRQFIRAFSSCTWVSANSERTPSSLPERLSTTLSIRVRLPNTSAPNTAVWERVPFMVMRYSLLVPS